MKIKKVIVSFSIYYPLRIWALKTCYQDISKIILASRFILGQLIEDGECIDYLVKIKKSILLFELLPFANLGIENL